MTVERPKKRQSHSLGQNILCHAREYDGDTQENYVNFQRCLCKGDQIHTCLVENDTRYRRECSICK